jgi:FkbM family methyltransferase
MQLMNSPSQRAKLLLKQVHIALDSIIRLFMSPRRMCWAVYVRLKAPLLPLDLLPSYEHKHLSNIVDRPFLFIDVGFNKGQFSSLMLIKFPDSDVWGFDPSPQSSSKYAPILTSLFPSRFTFYNIALGDQDCSAYLNQALSFDNNSLLCPTSINVSRFPRVAILQDSIAVQCFRLSYFQKHMPEDNIFLKIDVQGYEMQVLKGVDLSLFERIRWIYVELTDLDLYEGQAKADEIRSYILSLGYYLVADFNVSRDHARNKIVYCDSLFARY